MEKRRQKRGQKGDKERRLKETGKDNEQRPKCDKGGRLKINRKRGKSETKETLRWEIQNRAKDNFLIWIKD